MMRPVPRAIQGIITILLISGALLACSLGGSTTTITSGGSSSTTTTPPTSTSIPATCATALAGSTPTTNPGGSHFTDVPVPANTFATALTSASSGTGLWSIYLVKVCSQGVSVSGVQSFFATQLPGSGWAQTAKLPFDGGYQQPCGDAYCWAKNTAPRYVGLENVADQGNNVTTYRLRLFLPPPVPSCSAEYSSSPIHGYQSFYGPVFGLYIPLPPLTLAIPDDASGGEKGLDLCSAGTSASIAAFMNKELPKEGWAFQSSSSGMQTWVNAGNTFTWFTDSGPYWLLSYRVPFPTP